MKLLLLLVLGVFLEETEAATGAVCNYVPADVVYLFYSLQNPEKPIIVPSNNVADVKKTHFNKSKQTIFFVHGSGGNSSGPLVQTTRAAIVKAKIDMNIIGVDWRAFQLRNNQTNIYNCAKLFGKVVAGFLKSMNTSFGLNYSNLIIVGHSIAGTFTSQIGYNLKRQVQNMVGLETCSGKKAAKFVECIHTGNANASAIAHANFYPNGGGQQPHCPKPPDWGCNHWRVIDYYAESITTNKFVAKQCDSYAQYKAGKCNNNSAAVMGGLNPHIKATGKFYLDTNDLPPYAKG